MALFKQIKPGCHGSGQFAAPCRALLKYILALVLLAVAVQFAACDATPEDRKSLADGFAAYDARQIDAAESAANAFIKKNPTAENLDEAYYLLGLTRYSRGDRPAAAQAFLAAIEKSKRDDLRGKSYAILADMASDGQRWEQAMDYLNKAVGFFPLGKAPATVYYRCGTTLQAMGHWDNARPYFDKVIALKPEAVMLQRAIQRRAASSFALQFGAFKEGPNAAEMATQLRTAGVNTFITSEMREDQLLFLVRTGAYHTFEEADYARQRLLPKYPLVSIVP